MSKTAALACILVIAVIFAAVVSLAMHIPGPKILEKTGKIADIDYSAGGFGTSDITIVKFEDGEVLVFRNYITKFVIGKSYKIRYKSSGIRTGYYTFIGAEEV